MLFNKKQEKYSFEFGEILRLFSYLVIGLLLITVIFSTLIFIKPSEELKNSIDTSSTLLGVSVSILGVMVLFFSAILIFKTFEEQRKNFNILNESTIYNMLKDYVDFCLNAIKETEIWGDSVEEINSRFKQGKIEVSGVQWGKNENERVGWLKDLYDNIRNINEVFRAIEDSELSSQGKSMLILKVDKEIDFLITTIKKSRIYQTIPYNVALEEYKRSINNCAAGSSHIIQEGWKDRSLMYNVMKEVEKYNTTISNLKEKPLSLFNLSPEEWEARRNRRMGKV